MLPRCEATLMGNYDDMKQKNKLLDRILPYGSDPLGRNSPKNPMISPVSNPMDPVGCLD